jgi:hypothetical protein
MPEHVGAHATTGEEMIIFNLFSTREARFQRFSFSVKIVWIGQRNRHHYNGNCKTTTTNSLNPLKQPMTKLPCFFLLLLLSTCIVVAGSTFSFFLTPAFPIPLNHPLQSSSPPYRRRRLNNTNNFNNNTTNNGVVPFSPFHEIDQVSNTAVTVPLTNPNDLYKIDIRHIDIESNGYGTITFNYHDGTVDTFKMRGNGGVKLYNPVTQLWSSDTFTDAMTAAQTSSTMTNQANATKNYQIKCTSVTGTNTWVFKTRMFGLSSVVFAEDSNWSGFNNIVVSKFNYWPHPECHPKGRLFVLLLGCSVVPAFELLNRTPHH